MLYFSTVRGIIALDRPVGTPGLSAVLIEEVLLNGKLITAAGKSLSVPHRAASTLTSLLRFASLEESGQIRFRHRLSGGDQTWVETDQGDVHDAMD